MNHSCAKHYAQDRKCHGQWATSPFDLDFRSAKRKIERKDLYRSIDRRTTGQGNLISAMHANDVLRSSLRRSEVITTFASDNLAALIY